MGGILLVISAAVIIVVTVLLFNTIDNRLETAQNIIFHHKLKISDLGKVELHLKSTDISSDVYVQIWGVDGEIQSSFGVPEHFANKPFDPDELHSDGPIY